jgi:hypothetical protein
MGREKNAACGVATAGLLLCTTKTGYICNHPCNLIVTC